METDNFEDKVKGWISRGAQASKRAMETVGDKVQNFTDKSVVKLEKKQLECKLETKYSELGKKISAAISENIISGDVPSEKSPENQDNKWLNIGPEENLKIIKKLQDEIQTLKLQIEEKEKEIK